MALGADLEAGPRSILLRRENDRGQPADGMTQPVIVGGEQLQPALLLGREPQSYGAGSVVERSRGPRVER